MTKKIFKKRILAEGNFLQFVKEGEWEYVERVNCNGIVIIVAMTDENKVIFVEQYRPPVKKNVIEFPAGLVNDHESYMTKSGKLKIVYPPKKRESLLMGAKRELFEETGYKARKMVKLLEGPVSGGSSSDIVTMIRAHDIKKVGKGGGDSTESIVIHEIPIKEVEQWLERMRKKGCLIEPKIYTGLYFLRHKVC